LSIPSCVSLFLSFVFWIKLRITGTEDFGGPALVGYLELAILEVTVYLYVASIATTVCALACCLVLRMRPAEHPEAKLTSTILAISSLVALGIASLVVPRIIP